jgi:hypothetical protein
MSVLSPQRLEKLDQRAFLGVDLEPILGKTQRKHLHDPSRVFF